VALPSAETLVVGQADGQTSDTATLSAILLRAGYNHPQGAYKKSTQNNLLWEIMIVRVPADLLYTPLFWFYHPLYFLLIFNFYSGFLPDLFLIVLFVFFCFISLFLSFAIYPFYYITCVILLSLTRPSLCFLFSFTNFFFLCRFSAYFSYSL
jgi:hypothetical protein